jgi:hypothetical protein
VESQTSTSPLNFSASQIASEDFPEAVGPRMTITGASALI